MEIVIEAAKGKENWAAKTVQECMERAGSVFVKKLPMPATPQISSYWTH